MYQLTWADRQGAELVEFFASTGAMMRRVSDLNVQRILAWYRWVPA
jgi:hypothetical protein